MNFGKWFYDWSGKYTEAQFQEILDVETGGMLEIWVILYRITKDEMFRTLMDRYYRKSLFDGLLASFGGESELLERDFTNRLQEIENEIEQEREAQGNVEEQLKINSKWTWGK